VLLLLLPASSMEKYGRLVLLLLVLMVNLLPG